ncbi:MAG TPA: hypothetical protein VF575_04130 [Candidatus Saccharimonadales bacterium]|jgi:cell division protein FtsL
MNSKRTFYVMICVIVLLVLAIIGSAYIANLQLQKQSTKLVEYKMQSEVLSKEQIGLTKAKKDVATYSSLEKIAKTIVPQDKDQAQAVREIVNIAAASGIKPTAIAFPISTLGATTSSGAVSPAAGSAVPGAVATPKKSLSQLTPVKNIPGVYNLQITIQLDAAAAVPYAKFIDFLSRLEQNRRTAQVTGIVLQPSPQNPDLVSFTLTVDEFIKP